MADEETCKNPPCSCPPQPDGKYCSASCEGTGQTIELDCDWATKHVRVISKRTMRKPDRQGGCYSQKSELGTLPNGRVSAFSVGVLQSRH